MLIQTCQTCRHYNFPEVIFLNIFSFIDLGCDPAARLQDSFTCPLMTGAPHPPPPPHHHHHCHHYHHHHHHHHHHQHWMFLGDGRRGIPEMGDIYSICST